MLETHTPSCFSSQYVLLDNGKVCGKFSVLRTFSRSFDVSLLQRYRLVFKYESLFSSRCLLADTKTGTVLARARRTGRLSGTWDLTLTVCECKMVSMGIWNAGFYVKRGNQRLAEVNVSGGCSGSWYVRPHVVMPLTDQVMIGLVFLGILQRRRSAAASA